MQILSAGEIDHGVSIPMDRLHSYFRVIQEGLGVRRHLDLLRWLQGEIQHHLPHEILIVAWGNFASNFIQHDIVSSLPSARTAYFETTELSSQVQKLYRHWTRLRRLAPFPHLSARRADSLGGKGHGLSERESEIMDWVGKGKTNAEIGSILSISEFTVRNHLYHIFQKLGVYNRTQAASKIAQTWGMRSEQHINGAPDTLFPQTINPPLADEL